MSEVAAEVSGTWTAAAPIVGIPSGATVTSIACPAPTDCIVGGSSSGQSYLLDEVNGSWGTAQLISGTAPSVEGGPSVFDDLTSSVTAISCTAVATCTAVGNYTNTLEPDGGLSYAGQGFAMTLSGDTWSAAVDISGVDGITGLSCTSAVDCTLSGYTATFMIDIYYPITTTTATVDTETSVGWGSPSGIGGLTDLGGKSHWIDSEATTVTCLGPRHCTVGGTDYYAPDFDGNPVSLYNASYHGFVARGSGLQWSQATELKNLTAANHVSCSSQTHCVGTDGVDVAVESGGRWARGMKLSASGHPLSIGAVACASGGACLAAGVENSEAFALTARTSAWSAPQRLHGMSAVSDASCPSTSTCTVSGGDMVTHSS
jgi:hypothetical protein